MFDWMKKTKIPENVEPPEPTKPEPKTYYTLGLTNDNRVSFHIGYTTLSMTAAGVDQLISQLEFYKDQLHTEQE
jgi:hypothetical protein